MTITITCTCGRRFQAPESIVGVLVRCPDCGREQAVPRPEELAEESIVYIGDSPSSSTADSPSWGTGQARSWGTRSGKAVTSLALGMMFFLGCLGGVPAIIFGMLALREIRYSNGRLRGGGMAHAGITLGLIGCLLTVVVLMMPHHHEGAPRAQCANNLKQIGLAMHNYHQAYGCLPPAAITDRAGRPLLSWRVALLPYLEQSDLYSKFHLDEPWDSPYNLALLGEMPYVYSCPSDQTQAQTLGMTNYQVVIGPRTAFPPDGKPVKFTEITDGPDRTILAGESRRKVPWTKPEDLVSAMPLPRNGLGSDHPGGFNALFADGSVRFVKSSTSPSVLSALFTRNGLEEVSSESY